MCEHLREKVSVGVCMCDTRYVAEREGKRERKRERKREQERERGTCL